MSIFYPLDTTGIAQTNLVVNELHSVQPPQEITHASFIVADAAPFFKEGFEIWTGANRQGKRLEEGVDYFFTHRFVSGSEFTGKTLYGGIAFNNALYTGNVYLTYQTLGGEFSNNSAALLENITNRLYSDIRFVTWDQLQGVPSTFPPTAHQHPVTAITTLDDVNVAIRNIATAIVVGAQSNTANPDYSGTIQMIRDHLASPSAHTSAAVGLSKVKNYDIATPADCNPPANNKYMTPSTTQYMLNRSIGAENIKGIRDNIATLDQAITMIRTAMNTYQADIVETNTTVESALGKIQDYQTVLEAGAKDIDALRTKVIEATQLANTAVAASDSMVSNVQAATNRINRLLYAQLRSFPIGTHIVHVHPGEKVHIVLISGGGGSGVYYPDDRTHKQLGGGGSKGQDSYAMILGTDLTAVEPFAFMRAIGGGQGADNFPDLGEAKGGYAGQGFYVADRVKASDLLTNATALVPYLDSGEAGVDGDSETEADIVPGVGGWVIDTTGEYKTRRYGRGLTGNTQAGTGGSGARVVCDLVNDLTEDLIIALVVGCGGESGRAGTTDEHPEETHGVALTYLVN